MDWVVAIIFSNWELSKIYNFFYDYLEAHPEDVGICKIERFRDKRTRLMRDSNRTLILLKRSIYEKAINMELNLHQNDMDFRIDEYSLKDKVYPSEGYTSDLYIVIPKNIKYAEIERPILEKMRILVSFGVLNNEDFSLRIPLESRLTGEHRGYAYLSFNSVDIKTIVYIKALLQDSFIHLTSINKLYHLPVIWAKDNKILPPIPKIVKILKRE